MKRSAPAKYPQAYGIGLGGKFEMATLELREGAKIDSRTVARLAREAVALNADLGDPTKVAMQEMAGGGA